MTQLIEVTKINDTIMSEIKKAISEVADEITKELYDNLTGIYMYPRSDFYKRTNNFLNALIKPHITVNKYEISVTVGMDATAIHSNPKPTSRNKHFGEHASLDGSTTWRGQSVGEALLGWWDEGTRNVHTPSLPKTNYWYDVFGDRGYKTTPNYTKLDKLLKDKIYEKMSRFGVIERIYNGGD